MGLQSLTLTIVGITFAIYIGIAFWARAKSTQEFYVAGGDINPIANGMATAADWMSAASFISMAGLIAFLGYGGSVFLMGWTGGYVLLALLLAPYKFQRNLNLFQSLSWQVKTSKPLLNQLLIYQKQAFQDQREHFLLDIQ